MPLFSRSDLSNCIVMLNDGQTWTDLEGCDIIKFNSEKDYNDFCSDEDLQQSNFNCYDIKELVERMIEEELI